jgi:dephospho-CoA kinase
MLIILITGLAHSGKDTIADYIVARYLEQTNKVARKVALADALKGICRQLVTLFYGIDIPLADFYDIARKEEERADLPQFAGAPFKIRTLLQQIGTDVVRRNLSRDVWCDYVREHFIDSREIDVLIISDVRMLAEQAYFARMARENPAISITTIRVERACATGSISSVNRAHVSEQEPATIVADHVIANDGTFAQLFARVDEILSIE